VFATEYANYMQLPVMNNSQLDGLRKIWRRGGIRTPGTAFDRTTV
jgi:hypothetical protein